MVQHKKVSRTPKLTPTQRILVWHIITIGTCLGLSLMGGPWTLLMAVGTTLITLWTVRRLLVQRSWRIIITRSLEPTLIILMALLYGGLSDQLIVLSTTQKSLVLLFALGAQVRFLLLQFRVAQVGTQSILSLGLIGLINSAWALVYVQNSGITLFTQTINVAWVLLILVWAINYIVAHFWLERAGYHNSFLAGVWALISVEVLWLSSYALVFLTVPLIGLPVARSALILMVIAYAWGSMLKLHSQRRLSKRLVVEYGMICAILLIAVVFVTGA